MKDALLWEKKGEKVHCLLCAHSCVIPEGGVGFCACRLNENGKLKTLTYGKSTGFALDPIEKKPFYHFHPGSAVLSFGTPGCNFRCLGCQNWHLSQSPRESKRAFDIPDTMPVEIAKMAVREKADGIAYTYSEPTIFFEYARDTILETKKLDKKKFHVFVSNGFFSEGMWKLSMKEKLIDAIRIDLKSFSDKFYREYCGARLEPVLDSIKRVKKSKIPLELITLLVPGKNDSAEEIRAISDFVASLDKNIPLHFIRFFPQYKAGDLGATPTESLFKAKEIARGEGLRYVYVGNLGGEDDTFCPKCGTKVIERAGFSVAQNALRNGACPSCGAKIAGVWA
ncbi:Radical SAM superfamily protein [Candidatus Norongarragalina meridionalis]|nr:Radical SAM superfamily protein [Candidatus Norongarragalina meridionalis]